MNTPEFAVIGTCYVFVDLFDGFPGCACMLLVPLLSLVERLPRVHLGPRARGPDVEVHNSMRGRAADYRDLVGSSDLSLKMDNPLRRQAGGR